MANATGVVANAPASKDTQARLARGASVQAIAAAMERASSSKTFLATGQPMRDGIAVCRERASAMLDTRAMTAATACVRGVMTQ